MQFHLNGFRSGDPRIRDTDDDKPDEPGGGIDAGRVDVLIVGCGPTGLTLAAQLSAFPSIRTRIVDVKPGPLEVGQADGIACRTMEMFNAFGFCESIMQEAYWVNETTFWRPDAEEPNRIVRGGRIQDTEDGLSEFPHVILNQARVHDHYLEVMENSASRMRPDYSRRLVGLAVDPEAATHPVQVELQSTDPNEKARTEMVEARYVVGCDGARSTVRRLLGNALRGESTDQAWGVMDVLAVSDFPDIRLKSVIHSANEGSLLIIPREGGYLVRFYIELDKLRDGERIASRGVTSDDLVSAAQRILYPYSLDVREIAWWSVYEIGQRLCDRFDDASDDVNGAREPHVFIAGDACHTHSPKAGQGMNVSMQDAFNLGWKLAAVLRGQSVPALLLTYSEERQTIARELIEFDREFARMFGARPRSQLHGEEDGVDPAEFQSYFTRHGRFTAGTGTRYSPSLITGSSRYQHLAKGMSIGMRFHSAPVIRLADAKPMHLGHTVEADGRWRLFVFANEDEPSEPTSAIAAFCNLLATSPASPIRKYTASDQDVDAVIDVRGVFQQPHRELQIERLPSFLLPRKGVYGLRDYEKTFCPDRRNDQDIFDMRGIDRELGCVVVVRPDQYVANVLPLDSFDELCAFFSAIMMAAP